MERHTMMYPFDIHFGALPVDNDSDNDNHVRTHTVKY